MKFIEEQGQERHIRQGIRKQRVNRTAASGA